MSFKYSNKSFAMNSAGFFLENLGESLHSFSFAPGFSRGSFAPSPSPALNSSLNASWQFFNFMGGAETGAVLPTTTRNPVSYCLIVFYFSVFAFHYFSSMCQEYSNKSIICKYHFSLC